jgi:hypothetical protein
VRRPGGAGVRSWGALIDTRGAAGQVDADRETMMPQTSLAAVAILAVVACASAAAQSPAIPRTSDGRPSLEGVWTNSSITLLERTDPSLPLVLSPDQTQRLEAQRARMEAGAAARTNPEEGAPAAGGAIGGYNAFWLDRGERVGVVKGEARSSWITDPPDGRMPVSAEGRKRIAQILSRRGEDGPEGMNPADRCLVGSRGSGGPPMLNNIYNNTYQIVQTPGHVMINVEMMHDARIVTVDGQHRPAPVSQWLGDSVGRWEGDTFVVVTRNWNRQHGDYEPVYLSERAVVTERFTRLAEDQLLYQFEIDDPGFYTQTWKGEMTMYPSSGPVFEFACHEGNYALYNILAGARQQERRAGR